MLVVSPSRVDLYTVASQTSWIAIAHSFEVSRLRHILLTGASSGLGATLAQLYAQSGHSLTLFGRNEARLAAVAEICRPTARHVETFSCDVTDAAAMAAALVEIDGRRPVDIVIANAGIGGSAVIAPPDGEPLDTARRIIDVNLLGVINTIVPLVDRLCARQSGHIVIIGSMAGMQGLAESPVYSASKAAVRFYGEGLRRLLAIQNVCVTVVVPGFIATPMSHSLQFKRPFMWSAERAAERIVRGIDRNEAEIVFPWQLRVAGAGLRLLPRRLRDRALSLSRIWTGGQT